VQISVIIPSFNRASTIQRALNSVISQTSPADEIIVIDDGSTDKTVELIQQHYPQVKLIRQANKGVSAARNAGIQSAQHEWIALLDSDDEWLPEKLQHIREAHHGNPQHVLFHSDEIWIRDGTRVNQMKKHAKYGGEIFKHCLPLCVISPSAVVIQRSLFDRIGLFDEALPACEDYDLWLRLCHLYEVFYIDKALIKKYGGHADQLSRKYWGMDRFRISALHNLMSAASLNPQQQEQVRDIILKKLRILLKGANKHDNQQIIHQFQPLLELYEKPPC
jgi:glycosyltransferase involved in cell wall biosynthesis